MKNESAVRFGTNSRIHMGLAVMDLERSVRFYRTLFRQEPSKTQPCYTKFELAEPPVNLSLNEVGGEIGPSHPVAHFGIQVKSRAAVNEVAKRLTAAGIATDVEGNVTCCYAVQDKVWATDPDGNRWEVYVVLDNEGPHHHSSADSCCPDDCCAEVFEAKEAVEPGELPAAVSAIKKDGELERLQKPGSLSACGCSSPAAT